MHHTPAEYYNFVFVTRPLPLNIFRVKLLDQFPSALSGSCLIGTNAQGLKELPLHHSLMHVIQVCEDVFLNAF